VVFVDHATGRRPPPDRTARPRADEAFLAGRSVPAGRVRAVPLVMSGARARRRSQAPCTVPEHPAGALGWCGANPLWAEQFARGARGGIWTVGTLSPATMVAKTRVNVASRSRIRKRQRADPVTDAEEQVPRLRGGLRTVRVGHHAPDVHPPGREGAAPPPGRTAANRQHSGDIRAWAKEHGVAVSERGRIPATVIEQYHAAGGRGWRSTCPSALVTGAVDETDIGQQAPEPRSPGTAGY